MVHHDTKAPGGARFRVTAVPIASISGTSAQQASLCFRLQGPKEGGLHTRMRTVSYMEKEVR